MQCFRATIGWLVLSTLIVPAASAEEFAAEEIAAQSPLPQLAVRQPPPGSAAERGYRFLTEKPYLPVDFDQETFDETWRRWPDPLRAAAEQADLAARRRQAFDRYGLAPRPNDASQRPLQYVVTDSGQWVMNCFACHGGQVLGQTVPGLPNSHYALETLTEEIRATKIATERRLSRMDVGSLIMPLGKTNGTTNAVMFGVALMNYRDAELNILPNRLPPAMTHHDMDAPPWWHFHKKSHIYIDGFAERGHRGLMQFMLVKENGPEQFREWESDFRDIYEYLQWLRPPKYPFPIDEKLAADGERVFLRSCSECHGTYGDKEVWPGKIIPIDEVDTDRVRLNALTERNRAGYGQSWFAHFGEQKTIVDPGGYVAPPLDGVWATAPYLHNGSVPTLWRLLNPDERPIVWRRTSRDGYDSREVGLPVETFDTLPSSIATAAVRRTYFDTRAFGKGAGGHTFPEALSKEERRAVLEYLKTL